MHMISKKDLNSAELETVTTSRSPMTVITANGEVQTHEEATVYVRELENLDYRSESFAMKTDILNEWIQRSKTTSHQKRDSDTM